MKEEIYLALLKGVNLKQENDLKVLHTLYRLKLADKD
jgi:hypothetical protein